ncbi:MAG TPA: hypothetical protein VMI10_09835 [Terriglobales bacterium]|nr:hypothetical protein [Terriglobales bacterium]
MPNGKQFPTGGVSTPTSDFTSTPANHAPTTDRQTDQPNLETQLAEAEKLLDTYGWHRDENGQLKQTPDARFAETRAMDIDGYRFRDMVRAGDPYARARVHEETEAALEDLSAKFGLKYPLDEWELAEAITDAIEEQAEADAELKKEDEAELAKERAEEEPAGTPGKTPTVSLVRGSGSVTPSAGGAE